MPVHQRDTHAPVDRLAVRLSEAGKGKDTPLRRFALTNAWPWGLARSLVVTFMLWVTANYNFIV